MWDKKGRRERRTRSCGRAAGGMGALRAAVGLALFAALAAGTGGVRLGAVCRAPGTPWSLWAQRFSRPRRG